jgi:hypothetical protein
MLMMRLKKLLKVFSPAIALCMVAFFTIGSAQAAPKKTPVYINSIYTAGSYPTFTGTFEVHGAFETAGTVTMVVDFNINGTRAHCFYTFVDEHGTFTVREECTFATDPARGRWEIVDGTGAYAGLRGNGSALMPANEELWQGVIFQE